MRADILEAIDTIDAACFTGDFLETEEGRVNFKPFLERWSRALAEAEARSGDMNAGIITEIRQAVADYEKKHSRKPPVVFLSPDRFKQLEDWAVATLRHDVNSSVPFEKTGPELDGVKIRRSANPFVAIGTFG